jgi:hypothetical protein
MKLIIFILCSLIFGLPGMLSAELYKYYNQNGTLCFTDDLSLVPADQRPAIETIHEIQTKQVVVFQPVPNGVKTSSSGQPVPNETGVELGLDMEFKQLGKVKKNLGDEFITLKKRQEMLISGGKRKMNVREIKAHNQEINELNQDTLKYKEKQQAYFKRVEKYNLKLESAPRK